MNCKTCIHDGVCYLQEVTNDIDEQIKEFGCKDFMNKNPVFKVDIELDSEKIKSLIEEYFVKNDLVSVTRCAKCKYGDHQLPIDKREGYLYKCELDDLFHGNDEFCSEGVPKEEAE